MGLHHTPVDYHFPETVEAAWALKQQAGDGARFIAGGTDLLLLMERENYRPQALIDLTRIPTLRQLVVEGGQVSIGAAVTYSELLECAPFCAGVPFLAKAIRTIGGVQVRNIATLAGNLANASPAADTLPALYVLGARVRLAGPGGMRELPVDQFVLGVRRTALEPAELITHVVFDLPGPGWQGACQKLGLRRAMAIAVVSAAALLHLEGGVVKEARLALGAVAPTVIRVPEAEAALAGKALEEETIEQAARLAGAAARPIDDVRGSADYRKRVVAGLVRRTLREEFVERLAAG